MSINTTIRNFILENFLFTNDSSAIGDNDSFLQKGIVDSTGMLEVILFIEDSFGIKVEDNEMVPDNLDSINKIVEFINRKKPE